MTTWGVVATVKAPAADILAFAAHHLDLGAHRLYIYLDAPDPQALGLLKAHPRIRAFACDARHWRRLGQRRPARHQVRQVANATHAYGRKAETDWLIHIDVDEFLWPEAPVGALLGALPEATLCARVRPTEALAGDGTLFKAFIPPGPDRAATVERIYPTFGRYVKGGFMSHVAGKLFVRTGLGALSVRIHNVFLGETANPGETELDTVALCHCHARNWEDWIAAFRYRLDKGSYRADLAALQPPEKGGMNLHDLLCLVEAEQGEAGLRAFHDELSATDPAVRAALDAEGLLRRCDLGLVAKRRRHFPDFG